MKLTVTTFLTLDGVMQGPGGVDEDRSGGFELGGWLPEFMDADAGSFVAEWFSHADAFLLGRRTFETFAEFWPRVTDPDNPVAQRLNGKPKYVVAGANGSAAWAGTTFVTGDLASAVAAIKALPGDEVQVHGSGTLVRALHDLGLIDEYRLWTFPVVLGGGHRLFADGVHPCSFDVIDRRTTSTGVSISCLRPTGPVRQAGFDVEAGTEVIVDEAGARPPFDH